MDRRTSVDKRGRIVRAILVGILAVVAVRSIRKGNRLNGMLAGAGALALGYSATTGPSELTESLSIDTTGEEAELRCSICGQPILPGQRRGPNANGEIVHDACKVPAA